MTFVWLGKGFINRDCFKYKELGAALRLDITDGELSRSGYYHLVGEKVKEMTGAEYSYVVERRESEHGVSVVVQPIMILNEGHKI